MPMGLSGRILQLVRAGSTGFVEIRFASVQSVPASATLAAPRFESVVVALFVEAVAEFSIVDLYPVLVFLGVSKVGERCSSPCIVRFT